MLNVRDGCLKSNKYEKTPYMFHCQAKYKNSLYTGHALNAAQALPIKSAPKFVYNSLEIF